MTDVLNFFSVSSDRVIGLCLVIYMFFSGIQRCVRAWRSSDLDDE